MSDRFATNAARIAAVENERLIASTPESAALFERAVVHLPMGVASSFHANDPYPLYLARGQGSHVWDVDGNEYLDFHGGFKQSGYGKDMSIYAIEHYTELKHVMVKW